MAKIYEKYFNKFCEDNYRVLQQKLSQYVKDMAIMNEGKFLKPNEVEYRADLLITRRIKEGTVHPITFEMPNSLELL